MRRRDARRCRTGARDPRSRISSDCTLKGAANLLICPNLDAANILYHVLRTTTSHGVTVGPILLGAAAAAHILTPSASVRRVLNMTALAVAGAAARRALARSADEARR